MFMLSINGLTYSKELINGLNKLQKYKIVLAFFQKCSIISVTIIIIKFRRLFYAEVCMWTLWL